MPFHDPTTLDYFSARAEQPKGFDPRSPLWGTIGYAVLSALAIGMVFYLTFAGGPSTARPFDGGLFYYPFCIQTIPIK